MCRPAALNSGLLGSRRIGDASALSAQSAIASTVAHPWGRVKERPRRSI